MKKWLSIVIFVCFGVFSLFTANVDIKASTMLQVGPFIPGISANVHTAQGDVLAEVPYMYAEGKLVYCVQPLQQVTNGTEVIANGTSLNEAQKKKIAYISNSGYNESDRHSDKWYAATQIYIWEAMGYSLSVNGFADYPSYREQIRFRSEHFETLPSFIEQCVTLKKGETKTLQDQNEVLSLFHEVSHSGPASVERSGREIRLFTDSNQKGEGTITLKKVDDRFVGLSIVYCGAMDQSVQETIYPMVPANIIKTLSYRVQPYGRISFQKQGEVLSSVSTQETQWGTRYHMQYALGNLSGIKANVYARETIYDVWGEVVYEKDALVDTLISGSAETFSKDLPSGKYYVKEVSTVDGYVLNEQEYDVTLQEDNVNIDLQKVAIQNERAKNHLVFQKVMEESVYMDLQDAYQDVRIGIYTREDIKRADGTLLVPRDGLVVVSSIDKQGYLVEEADLPEGSYYLQELATNEHYVLDESKYDFEITLHQSNTAPVVIHGGQIENKLHRNQLTIQKIDKKSKAPLVAEFALYDENKEEIIRFETDEKGEYVLEGLPDATYFLKELRAPKGYVLDETWHKITVEEDVSYTIKNQKMVVSPSIDTNDKAHHTSFEWSMLGSMTLMYGYLGRRFIKR